VHGSAFTEPPLNLGSGIKKGSFFRNGEVKLVLKGVSLVDGAVCVVVGYDSGANTLKMIMPIGADRDMETVGGSEYFGDIQIDLATRWVKKVKLDELVFWETQLPGAGSKNAGQMIPQVHVRHLLIREISKEEFDSTECAIQKVGK
jgi:hypothetical protein